MPMADTFDTTDFPEAELCALRLDGDGFGLGRAVVPMDVPVDAVVRAASLAPTANGLVVDGWTAAWVHGAWASLPDPLTFAVDVRERPRTRALHPAPREARFGPGDVVTSGGVQVASSFRTAFDLARLTGDWAGDVVEVVRGLVGIAGMDPATAATAACAMPSCPNKSRAFARLLALRSPVVVPC